MSELAKPVEVDQEYYFNDFKELGYIPENIRLLKNSINYSYNNDRAQYFDEIRQAVRPRSIIGLPPYQIFKERGSSSDTAVAFTLPYCNPTIPELSGGEVDAALSKTNKGAFDSNTWNNAIKHAFVFEVIKALGVRDEQGKTLPVIAVGADSQDYQPALSVNQKKSLRSGSLMVYSENLEKVLDKEGIGRVHVAGYSQGASVAHSFLANSFNYDVLGATLVEMPTYKDRSIGELAVNYLLNKPAPKTDSSLESNEPWTQDGPKSRLNLEKINNGAVVSMAKSIALKGAWRTAFALTHGTMLSDLTAASKLSNEGFPLSIGWHDTSSLTQDIEEVMFAPKSEYTELLNQFRKKDQLRLTKALGHKAVGAPHLAGESPMYYSLVFGQSIAWAAAKA